ncbi:MAG: response regulator [Magnetococcales bacterium]|nr:response regulator [Magnetococcales bacterium]
MSMLSPFEDAAECEKVRVLLIDDQSLTEYLLRKMLKEDTDLDLYYCEHPPEALHMAEILAPSVILLDFHMNTVTGIDLLQELRRHPTTSNIPVLILSVEEDAQRKAQAFTAGADDYIIKLPEREEMVARIRYHARSYCNIVQRQQAEERYRSLFAYANDAICLTSSDHIVLDCNPAATHLFDIAQEDLIGRRFYELMLPADREAVPEFIALNNSRSQFIEVTALRSTGEQIPVHLSSIRLRQAKHTYNQITMRDVSEHKQFVQSLEEILRVAERASREKSEFLSTVSHEIRSPLNIVIGHADLLLETDLQSEQREHVTTCIRAGEMLLTLINNVLDFTKMETGKLELEMLPFDLRELLEQLQQVIEPSCRNKKIDFDWAIAAEIIPLVVGDRLRLHQVLFNLVDNAIKFTNPGGSITIRVKQAGRIGEEGMLLFLVTDTGIGIPSEKQDLIFHTFTQADPSISRKFGGSGLGLSICSRLVELMQGKLKVNSAPGRGSTFFFTAKLDAVVHPNDAESSSIAGTLVTAPAITARVRQLPMTPLAILIVDDSDDNCRLIATFFRGLPHRVELASNGQEALEKFCNDHFDLVLMDLQMPVMDGYEATSQIRAWEQQQGADPVPIIALTAHTRPQDMQQSLEAGCTLYLTKPIKKSRLLDEIQRLTCVEENTR